MDGDLHTTTLYTLSFLNVIQVLKEGILSNWYQEFLNAKGVKKYFLTGVQFSTVRCLFVWAEKNQNNF